MPEKRETNINKCLLSETKIISKQATKLLSVADTIIVCCGQKSSLQGKVTEKLQKTEQYVEMKKLTLNTNKTELIFFSRYNSDFGSIIYKNEVLTI